MEIAPSSKDKLPARLIRCAYRASRAGVIALVLDGVDPRAVNRILDPLVPLLPLTIPGVIYLRMDDDRRVSQAVLSAQIVFAATKPFRACLLALGVDHSRVWPVSSALALLGGEAVERSTLPPVRLVRASDHRFHRKDRPALVADLGR